MPPASQVLAAADAARQRAPAATVLHRPTWLASHVRLLGLPLPAAGTPAQWLAGALADHDAVDHALAQWLPATRFEAIDARALERLIAQALADLDEGEVAEDDALRSALARLDLAAARQAHRIVACPGRRGPNAPYANGPTEQVFWRDRTHWHLLELHHES